MLIYQKKVEFQFCIQTMSLMYEHVAISMRIRTQTDYHTHTFEVQSFYKQMSLKWSAHIQTTVRLVFYSKN